MNKSNMLQWTFSVVEIDYNNPCHLLKVTPVAVFLFDIKHKHLFNKTAERLKNKK